MVSWQILFERWLVTGDGLCWAFKMENLFKSKSIYSIVHWPIQQCKCFSSLVEGAKAGFKVMRNCGLKTYSVLQNSTVECAPSLMVKSKSNPYRLLADFPTNHWFEVASLCDFAKSQSFRRSEVVCKDGFHFPWLTAQVLYEIDGLVSHCTWKAGLVTFFQHNVTKATRSAPGRKSEMPLWLWTPMARAPSEYQTSSRSWRSRSWIVSVAKNHQNMWELWHFWCWKMLKLHLSSSYSRCFSPSFGQKSRRQGQNIQQWLPWFDAMNLKGDIDGMWTFGANLEWTAVAPVKENFHLPEEEQQHVLCAFSDSDAHSLYVCHRSSRQFAPLGFQAFVISFYCSHSTRFFLSDPCVPTPKFSSSGLLWTELFGCFHLWLRMMTSNIPNSWLPWWRRVSPSTMSFWKMRSGPVLYKSVKVNGGGSGELWFEVSCW